MPPTTVGAETSMGALHKARAVAAAAAAEPEPEPPKPRRASGRQQAPKASSKPDAAKPTDEEAGDAQQPRAQRQRRRIGDTVPV